MKLPVSVSESPNAKKWLYLEVLLLLLHAAAASVAGAHAATPVPSPCCESGTGHKLNATNRFALPCACLLVASYS
jgi:hypothetical protein